MSKVLELLHHIDAFIPLDVSKITEEERKRAFIKGDGTIKAKACAHGRKQREYIKKDAIASSRAYFYAAQ